MEELYAKVEVFRDKRRKWRARIVCDNGHVLYHTSQGYTNKDDLLNTFRYLAPGLEIELPDGFVTEELMNG